MESIRSFRVRVRQATGFDLEDLPIYTDPEYLNAGSIKVKMGKVWVLLTCDAASAELQDDELEPADFLVVDLRPRGSVSYAGNTRYAARKRAGCDARFSCCDCCHGWTESWRIGTDPASVVRFCPSCGKEQVFSACSLGL